LGRRPAEKPVCPEHSAGKPNGLPGNLFCRKTGLPEKGRGLTISAALNRRHKLRKAATGRRRERTGRRWKDNREDNREDNGKVTEGQPESGGKATGSHRKSKRDGGGKATRRSRNDNQKAGGGNTRKATEKQPESGRKERRFFGNEKSRLQSQPELLMQTEDSTEAAYKPGLSDSVY
jgi:hypothetical protein